MKCKPHWDVHPQWLNCSHQILPPHTFQFYLCYDERFKMCHIHETSSKNTKLFYRRNTILGFDHIHHGCLGKEQMKATKLGYPTLWRTFSSLMVHLIYPCGIQISLVFRMPQRVWKGSLQLPRMWSFRRHRTIQLQQQTFFCVQLDLYDKST